MFSTINRTIITDPIGMITVSQLLLILLVGCRLMPTREEQILEGMT